MLINNHIRMTENTTAVEDEVNINLFSRIPEPDELCEEAFSSIDGVNDLFSEKLTSSNLNSDEYHYDVKNDKRLQAPRKEMKESCPTNLDSDFQFLPEELSVAEMHRMYGEWCNRQV